MSMTGKAVYEETAEDWDDRFEEGWQKSSGSLQSLTFALNAFERLKDNVKGFKNLTTFELIDTDIVRGCSFELLDYGCALGDGTALLQAGLPLAKVTGIDFSPKGIEKAKLRWPGISFRVGDIEEPEETDVIFTSHVVEHCKDSAETTWRLIQKSRIATIVIVPFVKGATNGGHTGAEDTVNWIKRLPKPLYNELYNTSRVFNSDIGPMVESNLLMVWVK